MKPCNSLHSNGVPLEGDSNHDFDSFSAGIEPALRDKVLFGRFIILEKILNFIPKVSDKLFKFWDTRKEDVKYIVSGQEEWPIRRDTWARILLVNQCIHNSSSR